MAQTGIHYGKKWLWGDNYVNIQCMIMVLVHCPSSYCHPSINQVLFKANSSFKAICWTKYQTDGRANTAYCELFCWYRCVYELT